MHGGLIKRLRKNILNNPEVKTILELIKDDSLPLPDYLIPKEEKPIKKSISKLNKPHLTEEQVIVLKWRVKKGASPTVVAKSYNITYRNLRYIMTKSTWSHID